MSIRSWLCPFGCPHAAERKLRVLEALAKTVAELGAEHARAQHMPRALKDADDDCAAKQGAMQFALDVLTDAGVLACTPTWNARRSAAIAIIRDALSPNVEVSG
jgi:hypothetical protein